MAHMCMCVGCGWYLLLIYVFSLISRMTPEMPISVVRYGCTIYVWLSTTTYDYGCNTESYGPIRIATNVHPWLIRRPVRECVTWALPSLNKVVTYLVSSQMLLEYSSDQKMLWSDCAYAQDGQSLCLCRTYMYHIVGNLMSRLIWIRVCMEMI